MVDNCQNKVLVTGANGYIGSHVVNYLIDNNQYVVACDLRNDRIHRKAEFVDINVLEASKNESLYSELGSPTHVIHLAWQDGFNHNAESHLANLPSHFNFLKNMIDNGVESLSVMGTMHEVGYVEGIIYENTPCKPLNMYGIAKNSLRQSIMLYASDKSTSLKWLRAYYIYGDDEQNHSIFTKLIQAEKEGKEFFPFTSGVNFYDFIHINDLAKQISIATLQNNIDGIINVCSGEPVALKDKVEEYISQHNFKIKLQPGVFPKRKYDSPIVYGENKKISEIIKNYRELINA